MKEENGGFGCKIDMLTHGKDGEENRVELASNEHKKANAEYDLMFEQQSKNILSNICILSQLKKRFGVDISGSSTVTPLAMDVMGLRGYLYGVYKHEDVFVAAKKSDKHIVLPTTLAEFEEFSDNGSIFLLLNYMYYIVSAAEEILQNADNQTKRRFEAIVNDEYPVDDAPKLHFTYPNKKRHST
ncbi:hypothetical protein BDB00DRAFT_271649 [Zychaea mexicana]|uniref:uncharacterized protein n=1 Tax=Zychaea mexicana TaxID=64656 RepID=UPI0022FF2CA0|nr:uncharacterized protein BDB00DRAFT_271649 [Zychaea mexicana]KAI9495114.1 hypothetical protein BDB00DRAFT_271649 [Zychaea mexicana]